MRGRVKRGKGWSLGLHGAGGSEGAAPMAPVGERGWHPWRGWHTGEVVARAPAQVAGRSMGWAKGHWAKRPNRPAGQLGRLGRN
jgi:hypothetical protein